MSYFDKIKNKRPDRFIRQVGISLVNFQNLLEAVEKEIKAKMEKNPLKRRGKKSESAFTDRLLLTLLYLRQYPTFDRLGEQFHISESYACKIYHQICDILVKVLKLKNRKALLEQPVKVIFSFKGNYNIYLVQYYSYLFWKISRIMYALNQSQ